jgi:hypothetical protein
MSLNISGTLRTKEEKINHLSPRGRIVLGTPNPMEPSSKGHVLHRNHHTRGASYKGRIVQGICGTRDMWYKGGMVRDASYKVRLVQGTYHLGKHHPGANGRVPVMKHENWGFLFSMKITKHAKLLVLLQSKILQNREIVMQKNKSCFVLYFMKCETKWVSLETLLLTYKNPRKTYSPEILLLEEIKAKAHQDGLHFKDVLHENCARFRAA